MSLGDSKSNNEKFPILLKYLMNIDPLLKKMKDLKLKSDPLVLEHIH